MLVLVIDEYLRKDEGERKAKLLAPKITLYFREL